MGLLVRILAIPDSSCDTVKEIMMPVDAKNKIQGQED